MQVRTYKVPILSCKVIDIAGTFQLLVSSIPGISRLVPSLAEYIG